MSATYQFGANPPIDYPRMLIADTGPNFIFQDLEIQSAYNIIPVFTLVPNSGGGQFAQPASVQPSYRFVAAVLLRSLASNKARLAAQLKALDINMNTQVAAQELRASAKDFEDSENNSGAFAIAEMVPNNYAAYERVWKQLLRLQQ